MVLLSAQQAAKHEDQGCDIIRVSKLSSSDPGQAPRESAQPIKTGASFIRFFPHTTSLKIADRHLAIQDLLSMSARVILSD
jgi:hypothetical protein